LKPITVEILKAAFGSSLLTMPPVIKANALFLRIAEIVNGLVARGLWGKCH
jgi:hypothetical protein